jgi:hypothetical protein
MCVTHAVCHALCVPQWLSCETSQQAVPHCVSCILQIPASSISFANTFGVLFAVVIYDLVIVNITNR